MDPDAVPVAGWELCAGGGPGVRTEPGVHWLVLSGRDGLLLERCAEDAAVGSADVHRVQLHCPDHEACLGCSY